MRESEVRHGRAAAREPRDVEEAEDEAVCAAVEVVRTLVRRPHRYQRAIADFIAALQSLRGQLQAEG